MIPHLGMRQNDVGTQYRSGIYVRRSKGSWQKHRETQQALNAAGYGTITTEMIEARSSTAESYHQQYLAKTQMGLWSRWYKSCLSCN